MPPGGKFKSIYINFSPVLVLICMKATRIDNGVATHDVVKFQRDRDTITGDIRNFVDTVSVNEIKTE